MRKQEIDEEYNTRVHGIVLQIVLQSVKGVSSKHYKTLLAPPYLNNTTGVGDGKEAFKYLIDRARPGDIDSALDYQAKRTDELRKPMPSHTHFSTERRKEYPRTIDL